MFEGPGRFHVGRGSLRELSEDRAMTVTMPTSPLLQMAEATRTDYWNDSCAVAELEYAIERGATGATSNPTIVHEVLRKEQAHWVPRVRELAAANPTWTEVDLTWATIEGMAVRGAAMLMPVFEREAGRKGRMSIQTNPSNHRHPARLLDQALHFAGLAPNIQVKFPVTAAGIEAIEEATARGVNVNATVSFTVAQAIAAAEAVERGQARWAAAGGDVSTMGPVVTLMMGRLDDWTKVLVERDDVALDPAAAGWAGIAVFKRAYEIYRERGYRARLIGAAIRHRLHWTELVGADAVITLPHAWQVRFNHSGIVPEPRIDAPVEAWIVDDLLTRIPDFRRAYEPDGLQVDEFEDFGASARTLRTFIASYHELQGAIRDIYLPNPDTRRG